VLLRPYSQMSALTLVPASMSIRLVEVTAPTNSMARKRSPLPRNTVENRRSSTSPICSRITPMNQRKAIPANGTRLRLHRINVRRWASDWSDWRLSVDRARRSITIAVRSSTAKRMPAIAAERRLRQKPAVSVGVPVVMSPRPSDAPVGARIHWGRAASPRHQPTRRAAALCSPVPRAGSPTARRKRSLQSCRLPCQGRYCRAIATRSRSSGSMKWSLSSVPRSICTQLILPVKRLDWAV
jgi:hypothetical protein